MRGEPLSTGASPCRASKRRWSVRPRNGLFSATWPPHALWHGLASYAFLDESRPARQSNGLTDLGHGDRCHRAGEGAEVLHGPNRAWKGKTGGRTLPLHPNLQAALGTLQGIFPSTPALDPLGNLRADS